MSVNFIAKTVSSFCLWRQDLNYDAWTGFELSTPLVLASGMLRQADTLYLTLNEMMAVSCSHGGHRHLICGHTGDSWAYRERWHAPLGLAHVKCQT